MENGVLLTFPHRPIIFIPQIHLLQLKNSHFQFTSQHQCLRFTIVNYSKWDSNAEHVRPQNFKFNFNQNEDEEEDDDKEEEEESFSWNVKKKKKRRWWSKKPPRIKNERSRNIFDEVIESVWILKVFKSFGWFLPAIIISYLLASGPKAFLITLALSIGVSLLLLAFEKLWGKKQAFEKLWGEKQRRPKNKASRKRKASSIYASSAEMEEGEGEEVWETRKAKMRNQTWVGGNNGPVKRGRQGMPEFDGWDFPDEAGSVRGTSRVTNVSQSIQNGKLSDGGRKSDAPLLLRLLIAVFPFIGFLAKMFW